MKIYLHEITEMETELDFTQEEGWVRQAVERVDEAQQDETLTSINELRPSAATRVSAAKPQPRKIDAHFSLRKVDEVVVLSGDVDTYVTLVCSRCANPFKLKAQ